MKITRFCRNNATGRPASTVGLTERMGRGFGRRINVCCRRPSGLNLGSWTGYSVMMFCSCLLRYSFSAPIACLKQLGDWLHNITRIQKTLVSGPRRAIGYDHRATVVGVLHSLVGTYSTLPWSRGKKERTVKSRIVLARSRGPGLYSSQ